ncbi:MAG: hypothetical protein A2Z18_07865 [Armatimonadetes bacterium RBG_16_58_9]|nr:MAG: hypothetical protein A2Z18_07865 [Armatimonadetes bacterium RBG_16_58_9]
MIPFSQALGSNKILIYDGGMGTQLDARGGVTGARSNFENPHIVRSVHTDYKAAGADIILSNTFSGNRIALERERMGDKLEEYDAVGVRLARETAAGECYVAGDMGSAGAFMEPLGDYTEQQFHDNFAEQARVLAASGVDLIIIETMTDVREAAVAVRAVKEATGLPVVASIAFDPAAGSFRTMMGDTIEKAVVELTEAGADAIGSNCGTVDPEEMSLIIAGMRGHTGLPLSAEPNAGKPELSGGKVEFKLSPEGFADGMMKCIEAGATLVGGCCGTTPEHIAALVRRVREH